MATPGEIIKRLRESRQWSQAEFARKVGVTRAAVGKWEKDTVVPTLTNLIEITRLFDISLSEFGDQEQEQPLIDHELRQMDGPFAEFLIKSFKAQIADIKRAQKTPQK